jgi:hypothetical protein
MSLLSKASLVVTPNAYNTGKLYSVIPNTTVGDFTVSRASASTRINTAGNIDTIYSHIPKIDYTLGSTNPHILLEPQATNLLVNSATVTNQTIVLSLSTTYTFSFYGTGTITFSGAYVGTLVGTANIRSKRTFTSSASLTSLFISVSGSCLNGQLENLQFATSYIPTNVLTTRIKDLLSLTGASSLIGQTEGVIYFNMAALFNDQTNRDLSISDGTTSNILRINYKTTSNQIGVTGTAGGTAFATSLSYTSPDITSFHKMAIRYKANDISFWVDGINRGTLTTQALPTGFSNLNFGNGQNTGSFMYAKVRALHLFKTYLTDSEMISLTTL